MGQIVFQTADSPLVDLSMESTIGAEWQMDESRTVDDCDLGRHRLGIENCTRSLGQGKEYGGADFKW